MESSIKDFEQQVLDWIWQNAEQDTPGTKREIMDKFIHSLTFG
jgi:hypothetical protein